MLRCPPSQQNFRTSPLRRLNISFPKRYECGSRQCSLRTISPSQWTWPIACCSSVGLMLGWVRLIPQFPVLAVTTESDWCWKIYNKNKHLENCANHFNIVISISFIWRSWSSDRDVRSWCIDNFDTLHITRRGNIARDAKPSRFIVAAFLVVASVFTLLFKFARTTPSFPACSSSESSVRGIGTDSFRHGLLINNTNKNTLDRIFWERAEKTESVLNGQRWLSVTFPPKILFSYLC